MPGQTRTISPKDKLHDRICRMLADRIRIAEREQQRQHDVWRMAEDMILTYVPEKDLDARRRNKRSDGTPQYTTMLVPYTYAVLMSSHTYWTSVFFARSPVHQYAGRHGEGEQKTQALEALVSYNVDVGNMMGPYYIQLYDAGKYGVGVVGEYWDKETIQTSYIVEENGKVQVTEESDGYEGSRIYNVSPWDFLPDPRVAVGRYQSGEFIAIKRRFMWNDLVRRERQGYITNLDSVQSSRGVSTESSQNSDSQSTLELPIEDDFLLQDASSDVKHPSMVGGYEVYVDLIQKDWGLGAATFPEKWVFTLTSDKKLLLGAQPLGMRHGRFPFSVMEIEVEGYGAWNRGIPEIINPVQNTIDWLLNVHFFNTRSILNNLFLVDPSRVVMRDLMNPNPGGIIRLKPEAYGSDLRTMFYQVPIADITRSNFADIGEMLQIGERTLGVNDAIMGAMQGGGRKTATEVRSATGFGVNRQKTITEYISSTAFSPHSQRLVQTAQQYYTAEKKLRIVGSLAQDAGPGFITVTPELISGFYDFIPVDGTLPIDRFAQVNMWTQIMQGMARTPEVWQQYDVGKIFAWIATLSGVKNLNQFKIQPQVADPGLLAEQARQGNIVPIRPGGPGAPGVAAPRQSNPAATGYQPTPPIE